MKCSACGTENDPGSKFCMTCGAPLGGDGTSSSGETGDDAAPPSPFAPAPPPPGDPTPPPPPADLPPPPPSGMGGEPSAGDESPSSPPPPPGEAPPPPPPGWGTPPPGPPSPPPPAWGAPPPPAPAPGPAPAAAPPAWGQPQPQPAAAPGGWNQPQPPPPAGWNQPGYAPAPAAPAGPPDPNGLGVATGRLGNGPRKHGRTALAVAGAVLGEGEVVEAVVAGKFEGHNAVLVLSDRALHLVDDRQWTPVTERFTLDGALQIQGWQDDRTASLTLLTGGRQLVLDQITDRPLAVEMAQRVRYRTGS